MESGRFLKSALGSIKQKMLLLLQWIARQMTQAISAWLAQHHEQNRALPSMKWTFIATKNVVNERSSAARKWRFGIRPSGPQAPPPLLAA
jgi:ribosomal protein L39E